MKSPARVLLLAFSGVLLLALLLWSGTFCYWHFKIRRAVRVLEVQRLPTGGLAPPELRDAVQFLGDSDCRGLAQLVGALGPSQDPEFLDIASVLIGWRSDEIVASGHVISAGDRVEAWRIHRSDTSEVRGRKIDLMRTWWKEHGGEYHPWWRVWSSSCR